MEPASKNNGQRAVDGDGSRVQFVIPSFFDKDEGSDLESSTFRSKVREEARAAFLQEKSFELLNNQELQELWVLLEKSVQADSPGQAPMMNYGDFKRIATLTGNPKARRYFTATTFGKLLQDCKQQRVSIVTFFNYVMRKVWLQQTRIGLSLYDASGAGYLRESDFETYVLDLIPTLPQLETLDNNLYPFYVCIASRKFFFFLDPFRTGRIKVTDVLECSFLDDLVVELKDDKSNEDVNWFSAANAIRLYNQYIKLDEDQNGMLSREELTKYANGTYPRILIDQIFEVCTTFDNEIDFKTYVDFCLAVEYRKEPQSLHYFFKLLTNINGKSYIDDFALYQIHKGYQEIAKETEQKIIGFNFDDIRDEIYDLIKPTVPGKITLAEVIDSHGDIIHVFTEFWESREGIAEIVQEIDV